MRLSLLSNVRPFSLAIICLSILFASSAVLAKSELTYGPIQRGQSLWEIAKETRPSDDISVEQLVYALYALNPDAFNSGNMNLLKSGTYIKIPDTEAILKISNEEAKKSLSQHVHALDLLRVDARQLRKNKDKTRKYRKQIKKLQKKLAKYCYESRSWNKIYLKLVKAKRRYKSSKRKTAKLRALLLEKATLSVSKPIKAKSNIAVSEVKNQLANIQTSLDILQQSNNTLIDKTKALDVMSQRIHILEDELGHTDKLVVQLKNAIEDSQNAIRAQNKKTEILEQRFKKLENKIPSQKAKDLLNDIQQNSDNIEVIIHNKSEKSNDNNKIALTLEEQQEFQYLQPLNLEHQKKLSVTHAINSTQNYQASIIKHVSFSQLLRTENKGLKNKLPVQSKSPIPSEDFDNPQQSSHSKLISIGSILNGAILIIVLFILFFTRKFE